MSSSSGSWRRRRPTSRETIVGSMTVSPSPSRRSASTSMRDVEDALLEQVADPLRVLLEQPHRVARLDVLRQDQHADLGDARPGSAAPPQGPRRCGSAACGCRRSPRPAACRGPAAVGRRRRRPGRRPRSPASSSRRTMPSRVSITSSATTTRMGAPRAGSWRRPRPIRPWPRRGRPRARAAASRPAPSSSTVTTRIVLLGVVATLAKVAPRAAASCDRLRHRVVRRGFTLRRDTAPARLRPARPESEPRPPGTRAPARVPPR